MNTRDFLKLIGLGALAAPALELPALSTTENGQGVLGRSGVRVPIFKENVDWNHASTAILVLGGPKSGKSTLAAALLGDFSTHASGSYVSWSISLQAGTEGFERALHTACRNETARLFRERLDGKHKPNLIMVEYALPCRAPRPLGQGVDPLGMGHYPLVGSLGQMAQLADVTVYTELIPEDVRYSLVWVIANRFGPTFKFGFDTKALVQV